MIWYFFEKVNGKLLSIYTRPSRYGNSASSLPIMFDYKGPRREGKEFEVARTEVGKVGVNGDL